MTWLLAFLLKPFFAVIVFTFVLLLSRLIYRHMPDSRLKRRLFAPLPGHKPRDWSSIAGRRKR